MAAPPAAAARCSKQYSVRWRLEKARSSWVLVFMKTAQHQCLTRILYSSPDLILAVFQ